MRKGFIATGQCFRLGNTRDVSWRIYLQEVDSFGQHAAPLGFDGHPQFLLQRSVMLFDRKSIITTRRWSQKTVSNDLAG